MLYEIEHYCKVLKEDESPFGGIRVVLLCGGFYQMPPVQGHALYWNPNNNGRTKTCGDDNDNAVIDPRDAGEKAVGNVHNSRAVDRSNATSRRPTVPRTSQTYQERGVN